MEAKRYFPVIAGEKVYLSPINMDDLPVYTQWMNDYEVSDNLLFQGNVWTYEREREVLEKIAREEAAFAIVKKEEHQLIGNCSLGHMDLLHGTAELGIVIGDKSSWNQGYGTEAIKLLLRIGFGKKNLENIMLRVYEYNQRAVKCYQKVGFKEIGRWRRSKYINNKRYDTIFMDILRSDFYRLYG